MKYTTPSIEVVSFNSSDAPRIGMQWWYYVANSVGTWNPAPAGWAPSNHWADGYVNNMENTPALQAACPQVEQYIMMMDGSLPADAYTGNSRYFLADDGQSC